MLRFSYCAISVLLLIGLAGGGASAADLKLTSFPDYPNTTAELQVIHNAADPAAAVVDIYVNNEPDPFIDDFEFRTATPFVKVPAGINLNIGVAPGSSTGPWDIIADFDVVLDADERYVAIANGVLNPSAFDPNPSMQNIDFTLFMRDGMLGYISGDRVKIIGFHGATDAPRVDIIARDEYGQSPTLLGNLFYGSFSTYHTLLNRSYEFDVTPAGDPGTVVATYAADLSGLGGSAAVVFASGFLDTAQGPAFGLFAALPDGTVLEFPSALDMTARLQVIHNSADPAAGVVDIYVNGGADPFIDDFAFRAATPYVDVPAGVPLSIGVAPGNSTGPGQIIASFEVTLTPNETYVAIANGVLGPSGFDPNPDGIDIGLTLFAREGMREGTRCGPVDLIAFHGATDAPTVDIILSESCLPCPQKLADDLSYGEFSCYKSFQARSYEVDVTLADNSAVVVTYLVDLNPASGLGVTVFASGFLNAAQGPAFGLFAALPDGTVLELPLAARAREALSGEDSDAGSHSYALLQNNPNPFNPMTNIAFALPETQEVRITIYNANGREVKALLNERRDAGEHSVRFDAHGLPSGVYFYRIDAGPYSEIKKMSLLK